MIPHRDPFDNLTWIFPLSYRRRDHAQLELWLRRRTRPSAVHPSNECGIPRASKRYERRDVMNPSAKAAGLSFQLSSPIESRDGPKSEQRSDLRPHDNGPETSGTRVCSYSDCEYFTRQQLTCRNLASIRFSRYIAVCSGLAQSAFTYAEYTRGRRFSYGLSFVRHRFLLCAASPAGGFLGAKAVSHDD